jgi:hypothetical protein
MRVRWMRDSGRAGGRRKGRASQRIQRDNCRGLIGGDALTMTNVECSTVPMWSVGSDFVPGGGVMPVV